MKHALIRLSSVLLLVFIGFFAGAHPTAFAFGLDSSFGTSGKVTTSFSHNAAIDQVAVQSDGKIVAVGYAYNANGDQDIAVARYNSDGSLDTGFATSGKYIKDFSGATDEAHAVAIQSDGKIVVVGHTLSGGTYKRILIRLNTDGSLDTGFGSSGIVTDTHYSTDYETLNVAIQSDGKIIAIGYGNASGHDVVILSRYNTDGTIDTGYGSSGYTTFDPSGTNSRGKEGLVESSDGKLLVAGDYDTGSGNNHIFVARFTTSGSLDTAFGSSSGYTDKKVGSGNNDIQLSMIQDSSSNIVVSGGTNNPTNYDSFIARFTSSGSSDGTFGSGGKTITSISTGDDLSYGVTQEADGKYIIAGRESVGSGNYNMYFARYNTDGSLDTGFGTSGIYTTSVGTGGDSGNFALAKDSNGEFVAGGYASNGTYDDWALVRATNTTFGLDSTFGTSGKVTTSFSHNASIDQVVASSDGTLVAVGYADNANGDQDIAVARYNTDGSLDTNFATSGKYIKDFSGRTDEAHGVAIQSDGKIVVVGHSTTGATDYKRILIRLNPDGSLDTSFGTNGIVTDTQYNTAYETMAIAIQSDGKIIAIGYAYNGGTTHNDVILSRYNSNGTIDTSYGSSGYVATDIGGGDDLAEKGILQSSDGKLLVSGQYHTGSNNATFVVRYNTNGTLDTGFGSSGKATEKVGGGNNDIPLALMQDSNGNIVISGGTNDNGTNYDSFITRFTSSGSLDTGFGTSGKTITSVSTGDDLSYGVAQEADGKYIIDGRESIGSGNYNMDFVRYNTDGTLDTGFGTSGIYTTSVGTGGDSGNFTLATYTNGEFVAGGYASNGTYDDWALVRTGFFN